MESIMCICMYGMYVCVYVRELWLMYIVSIPIELIYTYIWEVKKLHIHVWPNFPVCDYLESWHIRKEKEPMNRDNGVLPQVYNCLISRKNTS